MIAPIDRHTKNPVKRKTSARSTKITRAEIFVGDARINGKKFIGEAPIITRLKAKKRSAKS